MDAPETVRLRADVEWESFQRPAVFERVDDNLYTLFGENGTLGIRQPLFNMQNQRQMDVGLAGTRSIRRLFWCANAGLSREVDLTADWHAPSASVPGGDGRV